MWSSGQPKKLVATGRSRCLTFSKDSCNTHLQMLLEYLVVKIPKGWITKRLIRNLIDKERKIKYLGVHSCLKLTLVSPWVLKILDFFYDLRSVEEWREVFHAGCVLTRFFWFFWKNNGPTMAASGFMRGLRANAIALIGSDAQATRELFQLLDAGAASDYRFAKALLQGRKTLPWLRDWQEKRASDMLYEDVSCWIFFVLNLRSTPSVSINYFLAALVFKQKSRLPFLDT